MPSQVVTLAIIFVAIGVVGIVSSALGLGAQTAAGFINILSAFVALIGIVVSPSLASRSARAGIICAAVGLSLAVIAAGLLATSPASNSNLWVPINLGRFGGVIVAEFGFALALHAALLRRLHVAAALAAISASVIGVAICVAIAGWETRV